MTRLTIYNEDASGAQSYTEFDEIAAKLGASGVEFER